ncbi:MAG: reverse transcriptase domain-containing protein, partial [Nitrososphaera sp.]|nr:reverse transcriptase domain-containing protein [Nitrososphaera sp.]
MDKTRPHDISMMVVETAYEEVKAKKGAAGVDRETIEDFERNLEKNLYKIWNRMSSGSYFPPPVRTVEIPKADGKSTRKLGIPTVSDRVAQGVAVEYLAPHVEPKFHNNSYGFRKGRGQKEALTATRKRCFEYDWVIDLDIKGFFDNLDFTLLMEAVRKHTDCKWLLLYIERWLKAPIQDKNGNLHTREKGTPQGAVVSPLLANIYLHHAFDEWMAEKFPSVPFERYADD